MPTLTKTTQFEIAKPFRLENDFFYFTAKSISEDFACEYIMKILAEQTPNAPIVFRHRHPADQKLEKLPPIFGRAVKANIIVNNGKRYLETEYRIPLKAPNGHAIQDNVFFSEWIKKSHEADNPIGISLQYVLTLSEETGKADWAELIEHTGTHYPACKECLNTTNGGNVTMANEKKDLPDPKTMTAEQLESWLEARTLEVKNQVKALEVEKSKLEADNKSLKTSLENGNKEQQNTQVLLEKLSKEFTILKTEYDFERSPEKKVIDQIVALEGEPEFVDMYKTWKIDKLEARLKKFQAPRSIVSGLNPASKVSTLSGAKLEGEPTPDQVLKTMEKDPKLHAEMMEFYKKRGLVK